MHLNVFIIHAVGIAILKVLDVADILLDIAVTDRLQFGIFLLLNSLMPSNGQS